MCTRKKNQKTIANTFRVPSFPKMNQRASEFLLSLTTDQTTPNLPLPEKDMHSLAYSSWHCTQRRKCVQECESVHAGDTCTEAFVAARSPSSAVRVPRPKMQFHDSSVPGLRSRKDGPLTATLFVDLASFLCDISVGWSFHFVIIFPNQFIWFFFFWFPHLQRSFSLNKGDVLGIHRKRTLAVMGDYANCAGRLTTELVIGIWYQTS